MYLYEGSYFGMHFFWWIFWVITIIFLFSWTVPVRRKTVRLYREDPLGILQRRYAAGEITTEAYEERKSRIERDLRDPRLSPLSRTRFDQNAPA